MMVSVREYVWAFSRSGANVKTTIHIPEKHPKIPFLNIRPSLGRRATRLRDTDWASIGIKRIMGRS